MLTLIKATRRFRGCLSAILIALPCALLAQQPKVNKHVTIFYLTWADIWQETVQTANNNIEQSPTSSFIGKPWIQPESLSYGYWGGYGTFHWWGKPAYSGGNIASYRFVNTDGTPNNNLIDYHADMLADAGIDFITIDATNIDFTGNPSQSAGMMAGALAVLQRYHARLAQNPSIATPKIAFFANSGTTAKYIWDNFYSSGTYANAVFVYAGKPLLLIANPTQGDTSTLENFTLRKTWGILGAGAANQWSFKEASTLYGTPAPTFFANSWPEERSVTAASQETTMFPDTSTAHGRLNGDYFNWYWGVARQQSPTFVFVNSWNEWGAQNLDTSGNTSPIFVDSYLTEYSADIEPMSGGHGSTYLNLLKTHVQNFKKTAPNLALRDSTSGTWYFKYYYNDGSFESTNNSMTFAWSSGAGSQFQSFVGDFNNDGYNDIGIRDVTNGVWHYAERYTGAPTPFWFNNLWNITWAAGSQYQPLMVDVDHDGRCDQVMRDSTTGVWYIRQAIAPYTFTTQYTFQWFSGANYEPMSADFNGDGRLDLALRDKNTGNVYFAVQNIQPFTFTAQSSIMTWAAGNNFQAFAGDFQRDNKGDIALRDSTTGVIYLTSSWGDLVHFNNDDNIPFAAGSSYSIHAFDGK